MYYYKSEILKQERYSINPNWLFEKLQEDLKYFLYDKYHKDTGNYNWMSSGQYLVDCEEEIIQIGNSLEYGETKKKIEYHLTNEVWGFYIYDKISFKKLIEIISNPDVQVCQIEFSDNNYGEFWFVTLSIPQAEVYQTFWGLGYAWTSERWMINFDSYDTRKPKTTITSLNKQRIIDDLTKIYDDVYAEYKKSFNKPRSDEAVLFSFIEELSDSDDAYSSVYM